MRHITREQAIEHLREVLLRMVDEENSLCRVAGWRKIFCHGFAQWDRAELEKRFPMLAGDRPGRMRSHLELQANAYQLRRQDIREGKLPCDVGAADASAPCRGWAEFTDAELERFHREICGEAVGISKG